MDYVFKIIHWSINQSSRKTIGAKIYETTIKGIHPHVLQLITRTGFVTGVRGSGRDILTRMYWRVMMGNDDRPSKYTNRGVYVVQFPSLTASSTLKTSHSYVWILEDKSKTNILF